MNTGRLEAFSDGVIAIFLTVMVLNLGVPEGVGVAALAPLISQLLIYVLSFIYVGIYWTNHHHMLQVVDRVNGPVLWSNLHLLFWLSLIPVTTAWAGRNPAAAWPVAIYGIVLLLAAVAFYILARTFIALHGRDSTLSQALGSNRKNRVSVLLYAIAIGMAFVSVWIADALYVIVAIMWLVPDRRIEKNIDR
jgi:uncharacterized membrane protein